MKETATSRPKRDRLNLRIPAELLGWVKKHLNDKHRTVTQEVIDHFTHLRDQERAR